MRHLDERNRLCTLSDLKNVWLFSSSSTQVCLKVGFGLQLQALMIVMILSMYNFIGNQAPRGQTSALRHAGWELSGWASLGLSAHIVWHSLAPQAQRADVLWGGSRGRYSAASSAAKVLPPVEGTPSRPTRPADAERVGIPSVLCLVLNSHCSDQTLTHYLDI